MTFYSYTSGLIVFAQEVGRAVFSLLPTCPKLESLIKRCEVCYDILTMTNINIFHLPSLFFNQVLYHPPPARLFGVAPCALGMIDLTDVLKRIGHRNCSHSILAVSDLTGKAYDAK